MPHKFRLLVDLPTKVVFPSVTYTLTFEEVIYTGGTWEIKIEGTNGAHWTLGHRVHRENFDRMCRVEGMDVHYATLPALIMEQLVKERRGEFFDPAHRA